MLTNYFFTKSKTEHYALNRFCKKKNSRLFSESQKWTL